MQRAVQFLHQSPHFFELPVQIRHLVGTEQTRRAELLERSARRRLPLFKLL